MAAPASPQIEADKRLLQFKTYEDYLNSLVTPQDLCNLQSTVVSRTIAELGYRSSGETLSREAFERRLAAVLAYLYPSFKPYELASEGLKASDPLQQELALRERPNRVGILATIIFVRHFTPTGFEVSGYIDYTQRLKSEDWKPFFKVGKRFYPRHDDLGYYHWRIGKSISNDSLNYKKGVKDKNQIYKLISIGAFRKQKTPKDVSYDARGYKEDSWFFGGKVHAKKLKMLNIW